MSMKPKKPSSLADFIRPAVDAKYDKRFEAAEDIGIEESVLSRICSGKRPGIGEALIEMICDALGLDKTEGVLRLFLTNKQKIRKFFVKPPKPIPFRILHTKQNDKRVNP